MNLFASSLQTAWRTAFAQERSSATSRIWTAAQRRGPRIPIRFLFFSNLRPGTTHQANILTTYQVMCFLPTHDRATSNTIVCKELLNYVVLLLYRAASIPSICWELLRRTTTVLLCTVVVCTTTVVWTAELGRLTLEALISTALADVILSSAILSLCITAWANVIVIYASPHPTVVQHSAA